MFSQHRAAASPLHAAGGALDVPLVATGAIDDDTDVLATRRAPCLGGLFHLQDRLFGLLKKCFIVLVHIPMLFGGADMQSLSGLWIP